jgi:signal transduction histidine kinase
MPLSLVKKFRPGIFGKFLILMLATGAAISAMLGLYWRNIVQPQYRSEFHSHIEYYQQLLVKDLGSPPDQKQAEKIGQKLHIGIRYENTTDPENNWQTNLFPQIFEEKNVNKIRRGQSLAAVAIPGGRLLLHLRFRQEIETAHILAVIGIVTLALFVAWLISRYLLRPVHELRTGMAAIEKGQLDLRLQTSGNDELADLKRNFNSMTQNLGNMLRDRDRLLADVSHELRSPLTRMKVALEFNSDKKTSKRLREEISGMQTIITALLDTERLAAGENSETVPVKKLLTDLCAEQKVQFQGNDAPAHVNGSSEKLKIAIRNVIENAKKHGAKPIEVSYEADAKQAIIRVADAGKGIPETERGKIFQPFYRSPGTSKAGYGLGLYMAMKIVESMHGQIGILPAEKGTIIEIRLPLMR